MTDSISIKKVPDNRPDDGGEWFDYILKSNDPTAAKLYRKPDWHWLDSLCGKGYHCVSYRVNRK